MARRAWPLSALAVAAALGPGHAEARDANARTSSLAWVRADGAETCIGGKALAEAVEGILGRSVFVSAAVGDVAVEGQIARAPDGTTWRATIRVSDDRGVLLGRRELDSPGMDCRSIDESLALVIALMIDPDAATRASVPTPAPAPPPPAPRAVVRSPAPAPATPVAATRATASDAPRRPSRTWEALPTAGWMGSLGVLPAVAWGPTVRMRVGPPVFALEVTGTFFLPQTETIPASAASVAFTAGRVGGAACSTVAHIRFLGLLACVGGAALVVNARPAGLKPTTTHDETTGLASATVRAEWRFAPPFFTALNLGVDIPLSRPPYTYDPPGSAPTRTLFRSSPVFGTGDLAVGLFFR